ncbi:hypothetical protein Fcan01_17590 [Folsomia candida]|uniref:Uncharacterized protein n=1 Tax=Folsomia candida TaxID=158441 RepID=A0A226DR78_FOLCA|nr:hypothetical protein Fcan01_17590 [Folsomia candida]
MIWTIKRVIIQKAGGKFPTNFDVLLSPPDAVRINGEKCLDSKKRISFGHLVIQLPSHYTGGYFRFRHEGNTKEFDMATSMTTREGWTAQYLAYYSHLNQDHDEILTGVRSCIIYNLEIEVDNATTKPQPPTLRNITPSFFQIIEEWKNKGSDKSAKVLPLTVINKAVKPTLVSTFLGPLLRENGITLFHGTKDTLVRDSDNENEMINFISGLRILTSADAQLEVTFASFLKGEIDNRDDIDENICTTGLEFDLRRDTTENYGGFGQDVYLFFHPGDDDHDIFEHEDWFKTLEFWRFKTHLFLTKYGDANSPRTLHAANALVSLEIDTTDDGDLFKNLDLFKHLLNKFLQLEDTVLVTKLLQICQEKSDFNKLFFVILDSGMDWTIMRAILHDFFSIDGIQDGMKFAKKAQQICLHIQIFELREDKKRGELELYFAAFKQILQKFTMLYSAGFMEQKELFVMVNFFQISEVLKYDLFQFMKSQPASVVKMFLRVSSRIEMRKMWVRLVTDLYCCTKLLDNWPREEETRVLLHFFRKAEKFGADIKGILGEPKRYGVLVFSHGWKILMKTSGTLTTRMSMNAKFFPSFGFPSRRCWKQGLRQSCIQTWKQMVKEKVPALVIMAMTEMISWGLKCLIKSENFCLVVLMKLKSKCQKRMFVMDYCNWK